VFTVTFVQNRRKGPFIRGNSIGTVGSTTSFTVSKHNQSPKGKSKKFTDEDENWEVMDVTEDKSSLENSNLDEMKEEEAWEQSPKKKKKKDKHRKKSEEEVIDVELDSQINYIDNQEDDVQEIPPPKKKKKKRKHSDE